MTLEFRPHFEKIIELLVYLAHKKPGADKYQAVKFFYLADREHLNRYGRPITFEKYYALPYGPVASNAKDIIEGDSWTMRAANLSDLPIRMETKPGRGPDSRDIVVLAEALRDVDYDVFSKSDIRVFDEIIDTYGDMSFDDLFRITHDHAAYVNAWARRGGSRRAEMDYSEMIESEEMREKVQSDIAPIAAHV
ncbi:putative phage-associated protein [Labrenzia sp. EL_126]|nr:putative phage-associated protein [Labrenzia sp. EL_126]